MASRANNESPADIASGIAELIKLRGKVVRLETTEGSVRRGPITGFQYKEIPVGGGHAVKIPEQIEINGDASDLIPVAWLRKLEIVGVA